MSALLDSIPLAIKITICLPLLFAVWFVAMVWIGILAHIINPDGLTETLPPYVSTELEPDELLNGDQE